jgi:type VII secretion protein EccE
MTEAPGRVRAVARVGGVPTPPPGPVVLVRRRRPGHLGWLSVGQLLLAEGLLVAVLALAGVNRWAMLAAAVVFLALLVLLFGRRQGRWWTERMLLAWRIKNRRNATPGPARDSRLAAVRALAPDLTVSTYEASDGERVGVARDETGWFAVAAVTHPVVGRGGFVRLPLDRLAQALREMGQPGSVVQVLVHSVPAPTSEIDERNRCVSSYRELLGQHGAVPADRNVWVAVRLDARRFIEAWVDENDPIDQAPAVVAALVRRMGRIIRRDALGYQALDEDGLLDTLVRALDLEQDPAAEQPQETWEQWRSAHLTHACFWVREWPEPAESAAMLEQVAAVPAASTTISMILDAHSELTDFRCLLRVATRQYGLDATATAVEETVARFGGSVLRLDGEHGPAVYATAPTGGGAQ